MLTRQRIGLLVVLAAMGTTACSRQHNQLEAMVPAGASSVSYIHQSDLSDGVSFHLISEPESYRYVESIRHALHAQGFSLCKKSAISGWAAKPLQSGEASHGEFWLSELYKKDGLGKFFMIRADGAPVDGGAHWRQGFLLAVQTVPEGRQDMASIKNFCE